MLRHGLELEKQARLADSRLGHRGDDLAVPRLGLLRRALERLHLGLPAHKLRQTAPRRALQPRAQRPQPRHFINVYRFAHSLNPSGAESLQREISFHQPPNGFAYRDRPRRRQSLQTRRKIGPVPDRCVLDVTLSGSDRSHDNFARVHPDPHCDRSETLLAQMRGVLSQLLLHSERRIQRTLRMATCRRWGHRFHRCHYRLPAVGVARCCGGQTPVPQGSQRSIAPPARVINTDQARLYGAAIAAVKEEGTLRRRCRHRPVQYLNNILEQDHRAIKRRVKAKQSFREFQAARRTIDGYEAMHMIRKGQARWVSDADVRKQNQFIDQLFDLAA
jgi:hypothetical protein